MVPEVRPQSAPTKRSARAPGQKRRTFHPLGFSLRLNLWHTALSILGAFGLFALAYILLVRELRESDQEIVRTKLDACRLWYEQGGLPELQEQFAAESGWERESSFLELTNAHQSFIYSPHQDTDQLHNLSTDLDGDEQGAIHWKSVPSAEKNMVWTIATTRLRDGSLLYVGRTTEDRDELLRHFRFIFLLAIVPMILLGFGGGAVLTFRALGPIRGIIGAVRRIIATGEMRSRVDVPDTRDEIEELVTLFNQMIGGNERLISAMRESLDNVAHDLRTPLTRLQTGAELALRREQPGEIKEALADAVEEAERLNAMLSTIMDISEVQAGTLKLQCETFSLAPMIAGLIDLYDDVAQEKRITLSSVVDPTGSINADRNRLQLVLSNLLDNALKYTPEGGRVGIEAEFQPKEVLIRVSDSGLGIEATDLPRIWERLYRADKSRSQRGLGLGLSLVKAFVEAHQGRVEVKTELGSGSTFIVTLPR